MVGASMDINLAIDVMMENVVANFSSKLRSVSTMLANKSTFSIVDGLEDVRGC